MLQEEAHHQLQGVTSWVAAASSAAIVLRMVVVLQGPSLFCLALCFHDPLFLLLPLRVVAAQLQLLSVVAHCTRSPFPSNPLPRLTKTSSWL